MKHGEVSRILLALKIRIEIVQGATGAQRLINQRTGRKRTDVRLGASSLERLTGQEEAPLQLVGVVRYFFGRGHQGHSNDGKGSQGQFAEHLARDRNVAPPQPLEAACRHARLEALPVTLGMLLVPRQEQHTESQRLFGAQRDPGLAEKKIARYGSLHAYTVAALAVGSNRAAMREAAQSRQRKAQNFVVRLAVQGRNKTHPAGIVVKAGAYEVASTKRNIATTHS